MLTTKQAEELREAIRRGSEGDVEHLLVDAKRAGEMLLALLLAQHDEIDRLRAKQEAWRANAAARAQEDADTIAAIGGVCGLTGTWVQTLDTNAPEHRHVVRFSFEGETHFEGLEDARAAGREYERIVADAVHGEELARLRAEVERLSAELDAAYGEVDRFYCSHCACSSCVALAREDGDG